MISERSQSACHDEPETEGDKGFRIHKFLRAMVREKASDLHFQTDCVPHVRLRSKIVPVRGRVVTGDEMHHMVREILSDRQMAFFLENGSIDVAEQLKGSDRFRINVFRQRGEISIAVRRVSREVPTFEELHLPPGIARIAEYHAGLVLLAGVTGCGKSTTIAATLEKINQTRPCHIVTIEDPIEYLYTNKKALVNQREIGIDVPDFSSALKYLMREDPDVVLIGEMRDTETFQAALSVAETGHLVFGTIHSSSASSTVGRILDLYPPESRELARQSLSFNLKAIVVQKLLPALQPGIDRVPAIEMLLVTAPARKYISEGRDPELTDLIRGSEHEGMVDFNRSLFQLVENEDVDRKVAFAASPNPDELNMMLNGISPPRTTMRR